MAHAADQAGLQPFSACYCLGPLGLYQTISSGIVHCRVGEFHPIAMTKDHAGNKAPARAFSSAPEWEEIAMARQKRHVFHSSLTKTGWVVREGGETVSRNSNQKANEKMAIAAAARLTKMVASAKPCCTRATAKSVRSAPMAKTPSERQADHKADDP